MFSNKDLARLRLDRAVEAAPPALQPFLRWIRKQKPDRNFRTIMANSHPQAAAVRRRRTGYSGFRI